MPVYQVSAHFKELQCYTPLIFDPLIRGTTIMELTFINILLNIDKSSAIKAFGEFITKAAMQRHSSLKAQHMVRSGINEASHCITREKQSSS
jgi:hypothetical protein